MLIFLTIVLSDKGLPKEVLTPASIHMLNAPEVSNGVNEIKTSHSHSLQARSHFPLISQCDYHTIQLAIELVDPFVEFRNLGAGVDTDIKGLGE